MKKIFALVSLCVMMVFGMPAKAQLQYGITGGANFANLNIENYKTNTATGWFIGPKLQFSLPIVGLGLDASLLYSRVNSDTKVNPTKEETYHLNYLSIPLNLRYSFPLPMAKPFIFAGPEFCWKMSDNFSEVMDEPILEALDENLKANDAEMNINVGVGVEVLSKFEVFVNYNFGLTNTVKDVDSKSSIWKVGGTFYF